MYRFNALRLRWFVVAAICCVAGGSRAAETVPLSSLDLAKMSAGWGEPRANVAVVGKPMSIAGRAFQQGVGTHAPSVMHVQLDGKTRRFTALVGVDDETDGKGTIRFEIYGDGRKLFDSGVVRGGAPAKPVDIGLEGVKRLILIVTATGDGAAYDHANWADAVFQVEGDPPRAVDPSVEPKEILTPKPGPQPHINGPTVHGARSGRPFLYRIPCAGRRPITFSAEGLPEGLTLDPATGIITGRVPGGKGEHMVTLKARNASGADRRPFRLVVGETLALTPPMGWNSWYIHYHRVTEQHMREAADAMVSSGMADYGYQYVNIDDCWMKQRGDQPYRDAQGDLLPNAKFPDIRGMVDYIHSKGLKAGTYISPGPWTCAGYVGSHQHEEADAKQFARWGFDFLKYDWCTYEQVATGAGRERLMKPYRQMGELLKQSERDIVYNLCQYGMGDVWKWGGQVGGNCWRTTGDLGNVAHQRLPGFYPIALSNMRHWQYARPGQWNDPDYILIGYIGDPRRRGGDDAGIPCALSGNEQYTYMSMWCLMAAPLVFSGDMAKLDAFTLNVLCNAEVIEVDQDPLGKQAKIVRQTEEEVVLAKAMEDGSLAVGLFNLGEAEQEMVVPWSELGLAGKQTARDLWRQQDIGDCETAFRARVGRHGVSLVRLRPAK
ncbi:MAG: NPCBM/NEW2 domain-containing protein [Pirellulales bacterium]|nr:NPCBM/NEW2 domain-containing protein [Pirellulales bacterium]